jgi:hypothetical protein
MSSAQSDTGALSKAMVRQAVVAELVRPPEDGQPMEAPTMRRRVGKRTANSVRLPLDWRARPQ